MFEGRAVLSSLRLERTITLRQIALLCLSLLVISWFVSPEVKAYLSLIGLIFIPFSIGYFLFEIFFKIRSKSGVVCIGIRSSFEFWMVGLVGLCVVCSFVSVIAPDLTMTAGIVFGVFCMLFTVAIGGKVKSTKLNMSKKFLLSVFCLLFGIFIAYWYIQRIFTFPLLLGSDLTGHLSDLSAISSGVRGIGLFDDGFILLIGISSYIAGSKALWMFWGGPLIQYLALSIGIYLLSRKVLNNYFVPIFAAIIPLWFMGDGIMTDPIFFLRRNVLLALIPFFILFLFIDKEKTEQVKTKPSFPFMLMGIIPIIYYFIISNAFYISTVSSLPYILQVILQPGFLYTTPALTFNMPSARVQDLYVLFIVLIIFIALLKLSKHEERKVSLSWFLITIVCFLINYRMGLLFSLVFFILILSYRFFSWKFFSLSNIVCLGIVGAVITGASISFIPGLTNIYNSLITIIIQTGTSVWSLPVKNSFLNETYSQVFIFLMLFAIIYLSFAVNKKSRIISIISTLTGIGLALYYLPIPDSERFLVFVTPFSVLLILISIESFLARANPNIELSKNSGTDTLTPKRINQRFSTSLSNAKNKIRFYFTKRSVEVGFLIVLILISGSSITKSYDVHIENYQSMYSATGSISSFTKNDLIMAEWLSNNTSDKTLVISDPSTIQILSGLAGKPYTLDGRYFIKGLDTLSIVSGRADLFKNVLSSFSLSSLIELNNLYDESDNFRGTIPIERQILAVINNRTSAWLMGLPGYEYASKFYSFSGLNSFEDSGLSEKVFNISSDYLVFRLKIPILVNEPGPFLTVSANSASQQVLTTKSYYDPISPNYTLSFTGSNQYFVDGISKNWLLESVKTSDGQMPFIAETNNGSSIRIEQAIPNQNITLTWLPYVGGNIVWKMTDWQDGWQTGPYSSSKVGLLQSSSVNGMLKLNLSSGVSGGYCSIFRTDLTLSLEPDFELFIGLNGSKNAKLAVAIDFIDGERIFLFNETSPTFFAVPESFSMIQGSPSISGKITGMQIFILSVDGLPCEASIKYLFAAKNS